MPLVTTDKFQIKILRLFSLFPPPFSRPCSQEKSGMNAPWFLMSYGLSSGILTQECTLACAYVSQILQTRMVLTTCFKLSTSVFPERAPERGCALSAVRVLVREFAGWKDPSSLVSSHGLYQRIPCAVPVARRNSCRISGECFYQSR